MPGSTCLAMQRILTWCSSPIHTIVLKNFIQHFQSFEVLVNFRLHNHQYFIETPSPESSPITYIHLVRICVYMCKHTIYYYLNKFLYIFKIFQLIEQNMYVEETFRNPMFCTFVLHIRHVQFFATHSRIFFSNRVGDTIFFNSIGKMSHIFGSKLDIVFEPYMTVLILLPCNVVLFLRL